VIRAVRLVEHDLELTRTVASGAGTWSNRRALTLVVEDGEGGMGLGEAAPLPGYSKDTLARAREELRTLLGRTLPERDPEGEVVRALGAASARLESASARMAVETALLDLWARKADKPAWALLAPLPGVTAPLGLSLWLPNDADEALAAARAAWARGTRSFKVKVGRLDQADPGLSLLEALRAALGPAAELRADANQGSTPEALEAASVRLRALDLRWLEEPTPAPLGDTFGVPMALDESLAAEAPDLGRFRASGGVAAILKPTALGGLSRTIELAAAAERAGLAVVFSHTLEGPVAFVATAALALSLGPGRPAEGLAPHDGLGGMRPSCLDPHRDELVRWPGSGLDIDLADCFRGRRIVDDARA